MYDPQVVSALLRCPSCHSSRLGAAPSGENIKCDSCGAQYPIVRGRPVLLNPTNENFRVDDYRNARVLPSRAAGFKIDSIIPSPSINLSRQRLIAQMRDLLAALPSPVVLVIGGGRQRQSLDRQLIGQSPSLKTLYTDIDIRADVDLFCDAHELPFIDNSVDAVVTTAVIEHVLYPERVASEIRRVLKVGGLLYSELPFMQQVHEGAFDFTRYTLSGHRRLLNGFEEVETGMVAGPGTALVWSIENFVLAVVPHPVLGKLAKALVRVLFAWLKYVDRVLVNRPEAMDGASCTFFFGRKMDGRVSDSEIIARYCGGKDLQHT